MPALNLDRLRGLAQKHRQDFAEADPFPHIVLDNFLPEPLLNQVLNEFPQSKQIDWYKFNSAGEKKMVTTCEDQMGIVTRLLLYQLQCSGFINFLETLTGINGLIPDPHLTGGGLHQIERGGYFKIHTDFNRYPKLKLDLRLAFILYLNKDWQEGYGGHIEFWNKDMTQCVQRILPIFNRCVIFNSAAKHSFHGHPEPLNCPRGQSRKSLLLYYYTNGLPSEEVAPAHTTQFQQRPGEKAPMKKLTPKKILKKLTPPIVLDVRNRFLPAAVKRFRELG